MNGALGRAWKNGVIAALALAVTACATYYQPRYGSDGVYFDQARSQPRTVIVSDPLAYPYWSLDYFYFSRFYHPYSIVVSHQDPWFYPYPGWYYGYRPGPRSSLAFSGSFYYPWYSFGFGYASYRPWRPHYVHYPHHRPGSNRPPTHRVHELDERLRAIDARYREPRLTGPASGTPPVPVRSETMTRHRIAEDRAAASGRPASRPASRTSLPRTQSTRPPATTRDAATRPTRERSQSTRDHRPQRQPPQSRADQGIDLSDFNTRRRLQPEVSEPRTRSATSRIPIDHRPSAPPPPPRNSPTPRVRESRPEPTARPVPAPRQSESRNRQPAGERSTRRRQGDSRW